MERQNEKIGNVKLNQGRQETLDEMYRLISELYKNRLAVSANEIEEKLKLFQDSKQINEYLISEILVKIKDENNLKVEVGDLIKKIENEGFENVAKSLSISESALNGGDLGWLNENSIADKIKTEIIDNIYSNNKLDKKSLFPRKKLSENSYYVLKNSIKSALIYYDSNDDTVNRVFCAILIQGSG